MNPADMRVIVERYIDVYNRKDIGEMLETVHPDIGLSNISGGVVHACTNGLAVRKALKGQALFFRFLHRPIR